MDTNQAIAKNKLKELIMLIPNFLKMLYGLMRDPRVPQREKIILGMVIAYVISPLDFIPDVFPFVGKVDDIFLVALILNKLLNSVDERVLCEHWSGNQNLFALIHRILKLAVDFLPGDITRKLKRKVGL